jgi:multiple sugar transport system ATP-binding protein
MTKLVLDRVFKRFDTTEIIHGVSFDINPGEFVVFVGPSGCGKSTLLRMIAGLETVTAGSILIDDRRMNNVPPAKRGIAMVFQSYALYPHMSVYENLAFGLRTWGHPSPKSRPRSPRRRRFCRLNPCCSENQGSFRADSDSASPSDGRLSATRESSCSMNPCRTLTPNSGCKCG